MLNSHTISFKQINASDDITIMTKKRKLEHITEENLNKVQNKHNDASENNKQALPIHLSCSHLKHKY